jgi:hypothetical protein
MRKNASSKRSYDGFFIGSRVCVFEQKVNLKGGAMAVGEAAYVGSVRASICSPCAPLASTTSKQGSYTDAQLDSKGWAKAKEVHSIGVALGEVDNKVCRIEQQVSSHSSLCIN